MHYYRMVLTADCSELAVFAGDASRVGGCGAVARCASGVAAQARVASRLAVWRSGGAVAVAVAVARHGRPASRPHCPAHALDLFTRHSHCSQPPATYSAAIRCTANSVCGSVAQPTTHCFCCHFVFDGNDSMTFRWHFF